MFYRMLAALLVVPLMAFGLTACDVDKTANGEMPNVDVDVDGGKLPEFNVETADVDVKTKEVKVKVPDIDVTMPDEKKSEAEMKEEMEKP